MMLLVFLPSVSRSLLVREGDQQYSERLWPSLFDTVRGLTRGLRREGLAHLVIQCHLIWV